MAITTSCCLKLTPPTAASSHPPSSTKTTQIACVRNEKWRSQCVVAMASVIIGLGMDNYNISNENLAMAEEMQFVVQSKQEGQRWSDKRTCPSWRINSLETIVPENLPRPSARRKWEAVGYSKIAPAVKVTVKSSSACFSM